VLLTSHYMEDVAALTPRVLVIDRGKMTFDGDLDVLVRRTRPDKLITLSFGSPVPEDRLNEVVGHAVERSPLHAVLELDGAAMKQVVVRALSELPVIDLKVEDAPLEEVMADFFAKKTDGA
jgi:ABC-2 type transport system ATP-binding protein